MKIACLTFTDQGRKLAEALLKSKSYRMVHYDNSQQEEGIKSIMKNIWENYEGIVFISATGIAARFIAPYIRDKSKDPAVVVIDDLGKFSISLLSGHLGGANKLASQLAKDIGGQAVITTASDNRGFLSLDLFALENNYYIENMASVKTISALMVNGRKIGFYTEDEKFINYPNCKILRSLKPGKDVDKQVKGLEGLIIVSCKKDLPIPGGIPYVVLRPRKINIGIGSRKGVGKKRVLDAIEEALDKLNLSTRSIKSMGTVEVKKDEEGIIQAAKDYGCPLEIFSLEEISLVEDKFEKSQFVKNTIGVYSVSEPSAYLLGGDFLLRKGRFNGITISITKE